MGEHEHPAAIPAGDVNVDVEDRLQRRRQRRWRCSTTSADIFDWADTVPGSLLTQIHSKAAGRFNLVDLGGSTYYIFLNSQEPPFNNQLAREAVVTGLNEHAIVAARLRNADPGLLLPAAGRAGPSDRRAMPVQQPGFTGNIAKAQGARQAVGRGGHTRSPSGARGARRGSSG